MAAMLSSSLLALAASLSLALSLNCYGKSLPGGFAEIVEGQLHPFGRGNDAELFVLRPREIDIRFQLLAVVDDFLHEDHLDLLGHVSHHLLDRLDSDEQLGPDVHVVLVEVSYFELLVQLLLHLVVDAMDQQSSDLL